MAALGFVDQAVERREEALRPARIAADAIDLTAFAVNEDERRHAGYSGSEANPGRILIAKVDPAQWRLMRIA